MHILNEDPDFTVNYYWAGSNIPLEPTNIQGAGSTNVLTGSQTVINTCPSIIKGFRPQEGGLTEEGKGELQSEAVSARSKYNQRLNEYYSLVDAGNTDQLDAQASGQEGNQYVNSLIDISPFLSQRVLESVIKNENFSDEQVYEVLYANPDVLNVSIIYLLVEYRPEYNEDWLIELIDRATQTTERTDLEVMLSKLAGTVNRNANLIISDDYLSSSEEENGSALDNLHLKTTSVVLDLTARRDFAAGLWSADESLLSDPLPFLQNQGLYNVEGNHPPPSSTQLDRWTTYKTWLVQLNEANLSEEGLGSYQPTELQAQALLHPGRVRLEAENILSFVTDSIYHSPQLLPQAVATLQQIQAQSPENTTLTTPVSSSTITAAPNPANTEVHFIYRMPVQAGNYFTLRVYDYAGNEVFKRLLPTGTGQTTWDCSLLSPGMYNYVFQVKGKRPTTQQLVIVR